MLNPKVGVEESQQIGFIFKPQRQRVPLSEVYPTAQTVDLYLEGLHLPNGDVLVDNGDANGCVPQIIVRSSQPKLFVIPNERRLSAHLVRSDRVPHLLSPRARSRRPRTSPALVNTSYPNLWTNGSRVHQNGAPVPGTVGVPSIPSFLTCWDTRTSFDC